MKRKLILGLLILIIVVTQVYSQGSQETSAEKQKVIQISHIGPPEDARHLAALKFEEIVEAKTNGLIDVQVFPSGQLGGDRDAIEGVKLGTIQMTVAGAGIFANYEPKMGITALPFLFENFEQAWAFNDSDLNKEVSQLLEKHNIKVLAFWENGFRCLTNSRRNVMTANDISGLKIRTPENPIILATMKALGASPDPLPWPEVYMALQQKAYDGQENPIPLIYSAKLFEVQEYLSITNHVYEPMPLVITKDFYDGLTAEQQIIVSEAAIEAMNYNRNLIKTQTEQMIGDLEKAGMEISYPDLSSFKEATKDVPKEFYATFGETLIQRAYNFNK